MKKFIYFLTKYLLFKVSLCLNGPNFFNKHLMLKIDIKTVKSLKIVGIEIYAYEIHFRLTFFFFKFFQYQYISKNSYMS
jgi:hypothetical protein